MGLLEWSTIEKFLAGHGGPAKTVISSIGDCLERKNVPVAGVAEIANVDAGAEAHACSDWCQ